MARKHCINSGSTGKSDSIVIPKEMYERLEQELQKSTKRVFTPLEDKVIVEYIKRGITVAGLERVLNLTKATIYRRIKELKEQGKINEKD